MAATALPLTLEPASRNRVGVARFRRLASSHKMACIGLAMVLLVVLLATFAPVVSPFDPTEQSVGPRLRPPSTAHLLGTDEYGRDVFSRLVFGARVSLTIAGGAVALLMSLGILLGAVAGYYGGWIDSAVMRLVDMMMSIPSFFLLLTVVALFGANLLNTTLVIAFTSWTATARLIRGQFLSLRHSLFVEAARSIGAPNGRIIMRHILPNTMGLIIAQATLLISLVILLESALSYLGFGAQPPTPSWGNMLSTGRAYMRQAWWLTTFPGLAIFVTVLAFNFLGEGVRDLLDPSQRIN